MDCYLLVNKDYARARECFETMQEDEMDEPTRARGAIMSFVTSMVAGDRTAAEREGKIARLAYEYLKQEGPHYIREQVVFLHQYSALLKLQGKTAEAERYLHEEERVANLNVPELQGSTSGTIGPQDEEDLGEEGKG
jgi:hypothetical protein